MNDKTERYNNCLKDCILALEEDLVPHRRTMLFPNAQEKMKQAVALLKEAHTEITESSMSQIVGGVN